MGKVVPEKLAELKQRFEEAVRKTNPESLIGVDEVGFGSVCGPMVIAGVGVPVGWKPPQGLTDSKLLSPGQIERLATRFLTDVSANPELTCFLVWFDNETIDRRGLGVCRNEGLVQAAEHVRAKYPKGKRVLSIVDGNLNLPGSVSIPKADLIVPAVSMASVVAKHSRDTWMKTVADKKYPGFGFASHVGYDTASHRDALRKLGPCAIHRRSNRTVQSFLNQSSDLFDLAMSGELDDTV